jgi:hypothetical protein
MTTARYNLTVFNPCEKKVRTDGHVLFHVKLYSSSDSHLGRIVLIPQYEDTVTMRDFPAPVVSIHESIQDTLRRISALPEHFGPWKRASDYHSYYRETACNFGVEVEGFEVRMAGWLNHYRGYKLFFPPIMGVLRKLFR